MGRSAPWARGSIFGTTRIPGEGPFPFGTLEMPRSMRSPTISAGDTIKLRPDFLRGRSPDDTLDRGIGIFRLPGYPYRAELTGVEREVKKEGDSTCVIYHTPLGSVSCRILYTEEMRKAGASITWISEHVIKEPKDYKVLGYIFRNIKITPDYENYLEFQKRVGERAFAPARGLASAGPRQHIMRDFLDATQFYLEMHDHPKEMRQLCEEMEPFYDRLFQILAEAPAEVVFHGSNFDEMITYPPFFRDHIMPYLQKLSGMLHAKGKVSHFALRRGEPGAPGSDCRERDRYRRSHLPPAYDQGDDHGCEEGL